jgi:thioredoxin reductase
MEVEQVVIIGAGPAGIATAIQLKRYGINARLFERDAIGGLLKNANLVENYLGFPGGISGPELVQLFDRQVRETSLQVTFEEVTRLHIEADLFQVETRSNVYHSSIVVIASGTKPRPLSLPDLPDRTNDKIFYEVYPLLSLSEKEIAILGAGDAGFDYALNLAKKNRVILLNRGETPQCLPLLWDRARMEPGIAYFENTTVTQIGYDPGNILRLDCSYPAGNRFFLADYMIVAFGRDPQCDFFTDRIKEKSEELIGKGLLYLVGDVKNGIFRQTSIAIGDGILAAMQIYRHEKERSR